MTVTRIRVIFLALAAALGSERVGAAQTSAPQGGNGELNLRLALTLAQVPVPAQVADAAVTPAAKRSQLAFRSGGERLSNGSPRWRDSALELVHEFDRRTLLIGAVTDSSRFGLDDRTWSVEAYAPLGERTSGYVMAATSETHRVLARDTVQGQLAHALADGWGVAAGIRHARYASTTVDIADLTLERYFGDFRAAVTVLPAHSTAAGRATSTRLQFGYAYGDGSRLQLYVSRGTEVDRPAGAGLVVATDVRSVAIAGRHWVTPGWGLDFAITRVQQGTVVRSGGSLGLRLRF